MGPSEDIDIKNVGYIIHRTPYRIENIRLKSNLLRLQAKGEARVILGDEEHTVGPGDLICGKPGERYDLLIDPMQVGETVYSADYFLTCRGDWLDRWWEGTNPGKIHISMHDPLIDLWKVLIHETKIRRETDRVVQQRLVELLYVSVKRFLQDSNVTPTRSSAPYRMKAYIEKHALDSFTLKDVADHAELGISRASQLFREAFHRSVMDYAIEVRLNLAKTCILYDTLSLEEVCYASGFRTYDYFSRVFHAHFGQSPRDFRKSNRLFIP